MEIDYGNLDINERSKVIKLMANNWSNIKCRVTRKDLRDPLRERQQYGMIIIEFDMNNKRYKTMISSKDGLGDIK